MTVESVLAQARAEGRTLLNEVEAKQVLRDAGIPGIPWMCLNSFGNAAACAGS